MNSIHRDRAIEILLFAQLQKRHQFNDFRSNVIVVTFSWKLDFVKVSFKYSKKDLVSYEIQSVELQKCYSIFT